MLQAGCGVVLSLMLVHVDAYLKEVAIGKLHVLYIGGTGGREGVEGVLRLIYM